MAPQSIPLIDFLEAEYEAAEKALDASGDAKEHPGLASCSKAYMKCHLADVRHRENGNGNGNGKQPAFVWKTKHGQIRIPTFMEFLLFVIVIGIMYLVAADFGLDPARLIAAVMGTGGTL